MKNQLTLYIFIGALMDLFMVSVFGFIYNWLL